MIFVIPFQFSIGVIVFCDSWCINIWRSTGFDPLHQEGACWRHQPHSWGEWWGAFFALKHVQGDGCFSTLTEVVEGVI